MMQRTRQFDTADGRPESGFSLLEVMIAVSVLSIAMTALLTAISQAMIISATTQERATALNAARQQLELMRTTSPAEITQMITDSGGDAENVPFEVDELYPDPNDVDGSVGRMELLLYPSGRLYAVSVIVEWLGPAGVNSLTLEGRSSGN